MSRSSVVSHSPWLDRYMIDAERAVLDGIETFAQTQDEAVIHDILELFAQFLRDRKRFPESTSLKAIDALIEGLLNVCNLTPSPEAGRAMGVLLGFLSSGTG